MIRPRLNIRVISLGIFLLGAGWLGLAQYRTSFPLGFSPQSETIFLEEWWSGGQGKGSLWGQTKDPQWNGKETLTVGRLIALRTDRELWSDQEIADISRFIVLKSKEFNVSPYLILSLIEVESGFHRNAVSHRGAMGLMQLLPTTAEFVAESAGMPWSGAATLEDPKVNIDLGLRYVSTLKAQFQRPEHVLTAYNMGPAALEKKLKKGEKVSLVYYERVMSAMRIYQREAKVPGAKRERRSNQWL